MMTQEYAVLAVKYGTVRTRASRTYLNWHVYGEPDFYLDLDYFVWVIRGPDRTIVVDTGFNEVAASRRGRTLLRPVTDALQSVGTNADDVAEVIITHCHYDHIGNLAHFPAARFVMSASEFDFWMSPAATRAQFADPVEADEIAELARLRDLHRLELFTHHLTLASGIEIYEVGGHTPGQLVVEVNTKEGPVILASDAVHFYAELEQDRPYAIVADLQAMYAGFDTIRGLLADETALLVPGHDPEVLRRFPSIDPTKPDLGVIVRHSPGANVRSR